MIKNKNDQKNKIIELLNSEKLNNNINSCYIQAYNKYIEYIEKKLNNGEDMKKLFSEISELTISNDEISN